MDSSRVIFRAGKPHLRYHFIFGGAIVVVIFLFLLYTTYSHLSGSVVYVRGMPIPSYLFVFLATLIVALFVLGERYLAVRKGRKDWVHRAEYNGGVLILYYFDGTQRETRAKTLAEWKLSAVTIFSIRQRYRSYHPPRYVWRRQGLALTARDAMSGQFNWFVLEGSRIDLGAFRGFAPVVVAELESRSAKGTGVRFKELSQATS